MSVLDGMRVAKHDPDFETNQCRKCEMDADWWDDNGMPACAGEKSPHHG